MIDERKFEEYFNSIYPQALKYTTRKVGNHTDAEDLTMDAFMSCYKHFDEFDETRATFSTWLYTALNNRIKNYYRDHRIMDDIDDTDVPVESFEDELLEAYELAELRNYLADALESLNDIQRDIVIMKYFKDMTANEIGLQVGLNPGNVRIQLHRAIGKMKDYFDKMGVRRVTD